MAPFKSESQKRKFASLVREGKIKQSVFDEWTSASPKTLPERVKAREKKSKTFKRNKMVYE